MEARKSCNFACTGRPARADTLASCPSPRRLRDPLRIVAPEDVAYHVLELLCASPAVIHVAHLRGASQKPKGAVILCDITREEASVIIGDLRELDIPAVGSIAVGTLIRRSPMPPSRRRRRLRVSHLMPSSGRRSSSAPARTLSCP